MYRIPKRIIQTGKNAQLSLRERAVVTNLKLLNPDYEYLFFDDTQVQLFIDQEFPTYRTVFDSFKFPIQRFDFFRYLAVYRYGGFYFDLDFLLASGLSSLLELGCVFPVEGLTFSDLLRTDYQMDWQLGNYAFGSAAGHPFLRAIIENCVRSQTDPDWVKPMERGVPFLSRAEFFVLNTTGPGLVSRTLAERPDLSKSLTALFPDDLCDPNNWNRFGDLGIHMMEGSWRIQRSFVLKRLAKYLEYLHLQKALKQSRKLPKTRQSISKVDSSPERLQTIESDIRGSLVSILIPAFNAEEWIADTIRSAIAQTWHRKEIIVVDDGSKDQTLAIARQFESDGVRVAAQKNQGAAAARNKAFSLSQGDYIQWLDADDLLAPDKIAKQMEALDQCRSKRTLFSSAWGLFMYRPSRAEFMPTALWCDLTPIEWLLRKMGQNLYMQTASWLVSRELTEAAGQWDTRLLGDDDGEYFCRVLLASDGTKFTPEAKAYYRGPGLAFRSLSYMGHSNRKIYAHWLSMQLHIGYLRGMEDSARVRDACLRYLQTSLIYFYPEKPDIVEQARELARELGGHLGPPQLSWKYSWMEALFGWRLAKSGQEALLKSRWSVESSLDKALFHIQKK